MVSKYDDSYVFLSLSLPLNTLMEIYIFQSTATFKMEFWRIFCSTVIHISLQKATTVILVSVFDLMYQGDAESFLNNCSSLVTV